MPKVLTESAVEQYRRDGYCKPFSLLEPEKAAAMRSALERLEAERGGPLKGAFRIKGHLLLRWMTDLVRNPRLLDAVEDLIGPNILCWTSQWWIKEPHSPQFVSWHQDSNYWGLDTDHLVSAWVALSPATVESGCMRFMPGSHLGPALPHRETWQDDKHAVPRPGDQRGYRRSPCRQHGGRHRRGGALRVSARARLSPQSQRRPAHRYRHSLHAARRAPDPGRVGQRDSGQGRGHVRPLRARGRRRPATSIPPRSRSTSARNAITASSSTRARAARSTALRPDFDYGRTRNDADPVCQVPSGRTPEECDTLPLTVRSAGGCGTKGFFLGCGSPSRRRCR